MLVLISIEHNVGPILDLVEMQRWSSKYQLLPGRMVSKPTRKKSIAPSIPHLLMPKVNSCSCSDLIAAVSLCVPSIITSKDLAKLNQSPWSLLNFSANVSSFWVGMGCPSKAATCVSFNKIFPATVPVIRNCLRINQSQYRWSIVNTLQFLMKCISNNSLIVFSGLSGRKTILPSLLRWLNSHCFCVSAFSTAIRLFKTLGTSPGSQKAKRSSFENDFVPRPFPASSNCCSRLLSWRFHVFEYLFTVLA